LQEPVFDGATVEGHDILVETTAQEYFAAVETNLDARREDSLGHWAGCFAVVSVMHAEGSPVDSGHILEGMSLSGSKASGQGVVQGYTSVSVLRPCTKSWMKVPWHSRWQGIWT
jgi:hypothetical protein